MKRYRVIFHPAARDEALDAALYIADRGHPETAVRWYEGLERAIASLCKMPRRCGHARERDGFPDVELRQMLHKSHRIIFAIIETDVHILHVRHVARQNLGAPDADEQN